MNTNHESELLTRFPPLFSGSQGLPLLKDPALLTDKHGVCLVWHLPGLLMESRHKQVWATVPILEPDLTVKGVKNWRSGPRFFRNATECKVTPGAITLSPAWFQQGHDVSPPAASF